MKLAQFDCDLVWDNIVSAADVYVIEINVLLGLLEDRKKIEPFSQSRRCNTHLESPESLQTRYWKFL